MLGQELRAVSEAIIIVSDQGIVLSVTPGYLEFMQRSVDDVIGQNGWDWYRADEVSKLKPEFDRLIATGETGCWDRHVILPNGSERLSQVIAIPLLTTGSQKAMIGINYQIPINKPSQHEQPPEPLEVATYIDDMARQLGRMAQVRRLTLLSRALEGASKEAQLVMTKLNRARH